MGATKAPNRGSLRSRVRTIAFLVILVAATVSLLWPANAVLAVRVGSGTSIALGAIIVLGLVVVAVLASQWLAARLANVALADLDALAADLRRAAAAEARGRRADSFLEGRGLVAELEGLRSSVRAMQTALRGHARAERTVLGATVHDLKAGLVGLVHLLDAGDGADREGAPLDANRSVALSEARRLARTLDAMVAYLRQEGAGVDRTERVDLVALAIDVMSRVTVQRPRLEWEVTRAGSARLSGDRMLLAQALENLFGNAVRIARTRVTVTVYPGMVRIEDDGPGLPGDLSALREPFASVPAESSDRAAAAGSLGLGLFLAHRILAAHDGGLVVERSDERGTVILAYVGMGVAWTPAPY